MNVTIRLQLTERDRVLRIKPNPDIPYDPKVALDKMNKEALKVFGGDDILENVSSKIKEDVDQILGVVPIKEEDNNDLPINGSSTDEDSSDS